MKKFILAILAMLIIASSMLSVNAFAIDKNFSSVVTKIMSVEESTNGLLSLYDETANSGDEDPSEETEGDSEQVEEVETRTDKWIEKMLECDEFSLDAYDKDSGKSIQVYLKNDAVACVASDQKIILKNDDQYFCTTTFPYFYYKKENNTGANAEVFFEFIINDFGEMTFVKFYEESGRYIEDYNSSKYGTMSFVFDGDDVTTIEIPKTNEVINFSYSVKDKDVKPPFMAIDITPLINFFVLVLYGLYGNL